MTDEQRQQKEQRLAQWKNMAEADPDNAMGWLSLGNAYKELDQIDEAEGALRKAIDCDPELSRAYQNLGQILIAQNKTDEAGELLDKGYRIAAEQGDVMPQRAMGSLLQKIGRDVPQVTDQRQKPIEVGEGRIIDRRTGKPGSRLARPPMRGPLGEFIAENYSAETWHEWIGMGTKVINELRLDLSQLEHQNTYDQQMMQWLGFTQEDVETWQRERSDSA